MLIFNSSLYKVSSISAAWLSPTKIFVSKQQCMLHITTKIEETFPLVMSVLTMLGTKTPDHQSYFSTKTKSFSREGKDLVILPLLQEICKDKMKVFLC